MRTTRSAGAPRTAGVVFTAAVIVYFAAVVHRTALGVAGVDAIDRFGLSATMLALFSVVQLTAYAGMQIPAGQLLDRFGARSVLVAGSLVMAAGQLLLALSDQVGWALVARVLIGAGDAPIFIGACRLVAEWFPPRRIPVMVQTTGLIGQAGQLASAIPVAWLLHSQGWTVAFATLAGLGVVAASVAFVGIRSAASSASHAPERFLSAVRSAARPHGTRLGFWSHFLCPFSANVVALLWGVPFFVTAQNRTPGEASLLLIVLTLSAMITGPLAGQFTARHPLRRSWAVLATAGATLVAWSVLLAFDTPRPLWQLLLFVVVLGAGAPISLVGVDFARTSTPQERLGAATGFVNMGGFTSTILGVLAVGLVLQLVSPPGASIYTLDAYRVAFAVLLLPWLVGLVGVLHHRRRTRTELAAEGVHLRPVRDVLRWRRPSVVRPRVR
ncbi:MFS transporter [Cellulomonas sp.]|uniref:MFS transporter n=1 Tax=Cellulomonas sp. TaxID=40001 RepID=UPI003BABE582